MSNIINTPSNQSPEIWPYPVGALAEMQQSNYANYLTAPDPESQAVEHGLPTAPIREGAVNNLEAVPQIDQLIGYETNDGRVIDPQSAEAVLASASHELHEVLETMPEAQQTRMRQEHERKARMQVGLYAPYIEKMREHALKDDFELAA